MPIFSFLLFVFISSFTPGPNNIMSMAFANKHGYKKTFRFCLGVGVGFFAITLLCTFLNNILISALPIIELPLTIFGVAYMLYLAYKILTSKDHDSGNDEGKSKGFFIGILLQFVNPKGILFGITVVSTFILPYYNSYSSYFLFSVFLGMVGVMSTFSWSLFGSIFQKHLLHYRQQFNIVMAVLLAYSAFSILIK
ncbi:LysE family transporter [Viridibacillus sp. FSL R5-0477]|uniref:Transporter, LysE family protein n=1 Tax=Viridibacillus arenosi FSL R5-213 TaxID=1227360 RepID=W4F2C3_9BACL|nr:LysE family transporter [Viridibacillus arenosi]ETT86624.1 Transporter, LysE family protein [Viridibacillus arenosi FSL R5-213]OMC88036.1 lysine transporter LysE [Viridibacillus arenosi]